MIPGRHAGAVPAARNPGRALPAAVAVGAVGCLAALVLAYGALAARLGAGGAARQGVFLSSYALALAAGGVVAWRARVAATLWQRALRPHPVRLALLAANLAWLAIMVLHIFTEWGLIALLGLGAVGVLAVMLAGCGQRERWVGACLARSPLSFAVLYVLLLSGELYLRQHPERVGGGGGGNPALARLYDGLYTINARGLRGDDFADRPSAGTYRILALGDSFTFGQGVADDEVYAARLPTLLGPGPEGGPVQVINAGHLGADTAWLQGWLRDEGLRLQPDLVLLQFYANDVRPATPARQARHNRWLEWVIRRPLQRSYLAFGLRYRFDAWLRAAGRPVGAPAPDFQDGIAADIQRDGPGWLAFGQALAGIARTCREADVDLMLVLFPHPGPPLPATARVHDAVAGRCAELGVPVLDLRPFVASLPAAEQVVSSFDHHPSPAYHHRAAQALAQVLAARLQPSR